ncbi:MAG: nitroreductase family protein [Bacteroidetes bacterium]|nr:nitroreductase family protein [Bacteroidota bacterium]
MNHLTENKTLIDLLQWRYATKKMSGKSVTQDKIDLIIEATRLAPSSSGLQPFKIMVINKPELKQQIFPIANNQQQIIGSSHILVFAAWHQYTQERVYAMIDHINTERGLPISNGDGFKKGIGGLFTLSQEQQKAHITQQVYLAFGIAIAAAAELGVDASPMEGFNREALDDLLGLEALQLKSVLIMPLGYRDEEADWLVKLKKVRTPRRDFVITNPGTL